jgi:hypothetical protein
MDQQAAVSTAGAGSRVPPAPIRGAATLKENIMRKSVVLVTVGPTLGVGATAAEAESWGRPRTTAAESQLLSIGALQTKVEAQGYTVRKAKLKNACGELYTADKNGARFELFVDPTSGAIIGKL